MKREEFGRVLRVGPTKTHQARKIALHVVTLVVIDTYCPKAEGWAADAGVSIPADGYMLTEDPTGRAPMAPDTLTHCFSQLVLRAGGVLYGFTTLMRFRRPIRKSPGSSRRAAL